MLVRGEYAEAGLVAHPANTHDTLTAEDEVRQVLIQLLGPAPSRVGEPAHALLQVLDRYDTYRSTQHHHEALVSSALIADIRAVIAAELAVDERPGGRDLSLRPRQRRARQPPRPEGPVHRPIAHRLGRGLFYCHRSGGGDAVGASTWHYVVGYQADVRRAFVKLQQSVLADGSYYHGLGGRLAFTSMAELDKTRNTDGFWEEGTHSILDMMAFSGPDGQDDVAVVRQLRDDEVRASFGHGRPTAADFERFVKGDWMVNRWEGRATVLYRDGNPDGLAFWGISGD